MKPYEKKILNTGDELNRLGYIVAVLIIFAIVLFGVVIYEAVAG